MSQPEQLDHVDNMGNMDQNMGNTDQNTGNAGNTGQSMVSDPYASESTQDIYNTPDTGRISAETEDAGEAHDTHGLFSGDGNSGNIQQDRNLYGNAGYGNNDYNNSGQYGGNAYNNAGQGNAGYGNSGYNGGQYGSNAYNNAGQGNTGYGNSGYNGGQYGNSAYNNGGQGSAGYGNGQYGNNASNGGYGVPPYNAGPYSPYAQPQKKSHTGLIIGIVIGVIVLFLVALFALAFKAVKMVEEKRETISDYDFDDYDSDDYDFNDEDYDYDFDDDFDHDRHDDFDDDFDRDFDDDYGYEYDSDKYYEFHDEIRHDLSYSVDFEKFEYDTDYEYVEIKANYPVITGEDIPNLEKINDAIKQEAVYFADYFDEEYIDYYDDEDGYFVAYSECYVTYMDEEKISIVFSEEVSSDYFDLSGFLCCFNIDMENGVILDNEQMVRLDDDFSVDFRKRSDVQNGEISYLTSLTDQEITEYFNSDNLIIFYTPMGMEIGFNFEYGWVTVTYQDYEQYLKVF